MNASPIGCFGPRDDVEAPVRVGALAVTRLRGEPVVGSPALGREAHPAYFGGCISGGSRTSTAASCPGFTSASLRSTP